MSTTTSPKRRTTTYLPWHIARQLVTDLQDEGQHNVALMLAAQMYFGLRIGDVLKLTWSQITAPTFTLFEDKTQKPRQITVHPDFAAVRDNYLATFYEDHRPAGNRPIFVGTRGPRTGQPISVTAANNRFASALKRHGIETANASTHTMRKTFARRVWESKGRTEAALVLLSEVLNHSSTAITRRYLGITGEEVAGAYLGL